MPEVGVDELQGVARAKGQAAGPVAKAQAAEGAPEKGRARPNANKVGKGKGRPQPGPRGAKPSGELRGLSEEDLFGPTERTAAEEQFVLPGAGRISSAELAKRRAAEPLKPKVAQRPLEEGLFGELAKQEELPVKPAAPPSKLGMSRMLAQKQKAEAPAPAARETGVGPEKTGVVAPERFEVDEAQEVRTDPWMILALRVIDARRA